MIITKESLSEEINKLPLIKSSSEWNKTYLFILQNHRGILYFDKKKALTETFKNIDKGTPSEYFIIKNILDTPELLKLILNDDGIMKLFEKAYTLCIVENKANIAVNNITVLKEIKYTNKINKNSNSIINRMIKHQSNLNQYLKQSFIKFEQELRIPKASREEIVFSVNQTFPNLKELNSLFLYMQHACFWIAKDFQIVREKNGPLLQSIGTHIKYDEKYNPIEKILLSEQERQYTSSFTGRIGAMFFISLLEPYTNKEIEYYISHLLLAAKEDSNYIMHGAQIERIVPAFEYYKEEKWDETIFTIVPKIEYALKLYFPESFIIKSSDGTTTYQSQMLNYFLTEISNEGSAEVKTMINFIKLCLTSKDGENIRNKIAHGDSDYTDNKLCAALSIICLILVSLISKNGDKFQLNQITLSANP